MRINSAIIGLLSLAALSCSYEESFVLADDYDNSAVEFYATIDEQPDADTKVYADDQLRVLWNADDRITIFNKNTYNQQYRFTGEDGDNAGGFKVVNSDDEFATSNSLDEIYAVYPYQENTKISNDGVISTSIPSAQTYKENSFGVGANVMVTKSETNMLKFKNLGGYLSLKFYGAGVSVSSITLKSNNGELIAGDCTVDMSSGSPVSSLIASKATDEVTLTCPSPIELGATSSEATQFIFVLSPVTLAGGFTVTVTTSNGGVFEKSSTSKRVVARSSITRLGALEIEPSITDLSEIATANSYIVSSPGAYKFFCRVQGNSSDAIVGAPTSAEVLWESFNTSVKPSVGDVITDVRYEDDYVYFSTSSPFHEGNALISLKNSSGNVLWSWHIWVTSADLESLAQKYPNGVGEMMDRNLGALTNEPTNDARSFGLYYQWGRKDPFLANGITGSSASWPMTVSAQEVGGYIDNGAKSIAYSISHPTTFITWNGYNYDWCYGFNPMEGYDSTRWGTEKTKYDPCPPGWRVPDGGTNGFWVKSGIDNLKPTSFSENHGLLLEGADSDGRDIYYPAGGYLEYGSGIVYNVGTGGCYWASNGWRRSANSFDFYSYEVYGNSSDWRSNGKNVRCVRENSQKSVATPSDFDSINMSSYDYTILGYSGGGANCYVVLSSSSSRYYSFKTYKGNSSELLEGISSAEVIWESSGTDEVISPGSVIRDVSYYRNTISFELPNPIRSGNALIAAKNSEGSIIWSWHIWITDDLGKNTYPNSAGIVMDRNLGASEKNDAGLVYQWGRKDPFLNRYHYNYDSDDDYYMTSTIEWPSSVLSTLGGTVDYAISHPTTIITNQSYDGNWLNTEDNTLWSSNKTIYDPCPAGWRVPDGGPDGLWARTGFPETVSDNGLSVLSSYMSTYFDGAYYPPTSGNDDNRYGDYWSTTSYDSTIAFGFRYSAVYDDDNGYRVNSGSRAQSYKKSLGAVRCVRY